MNGANGTPPPPEPSPPGGWFFRLLWRRKWVVLFTLLLSLGGAYLYLSKATKLYTSTVRLQVRMLSSGGPNAGPANPAASSSSVLVSSEMDKIKGDVVLSIAAHSLQKKYSNKTLREMVDTELDRATENISITARSPDKAEAIEVAEAVFKAYETSAAQPSQEGNSPEKLRDRYRAEQKAHYGNADKKDEELRELEKKHGPAVRAGDRSNLRQRRVETLQQELLSAMKDVNEAKAELEAAQAKLARLGTTQPASRPVDPIEDADLGTHSPQAIAMLRAEMIQVQAQLREAEQKYLPEHPTVVRLRRHASRLNLILLESMEQRARIAQRQVDALQVELEKAQNELAQLDNVAGDYQRVKSERDRERALGDSYDVKVRDLQYGGLDVRRYDGPTVPDAPSLPDPQKIYVLAVALGLVLGMLFAAAREWVDDRMRSAGEIRHSLGIPLLAVIPQSTTKRSFSVMGQRVVLDPASDAAEAYRSLRTAIQFSAPEGLKTLMISSPNSGDGKTTLVSNLGIALAQAGKKVCIVDADLRKPSVHDIFSIKTTLGLSTLLGGRSTLDGTIQHTNVNGLDVLPCGPVPANPMEVLNSQEFNDTLEELADRYDLVLLDSPPVQSANDARVIAASCDATLIVLTAKSAHRRSTEQTRDALQGVGARVIGLVVNDVPGKTGTTYGGTPKGMRTVVPGLTSQEHDILQARAK